MIRKIFFGLCVSVVFASQVNAMAPWLKVCSEQFPTNLVQQVKCDLVHINASYVYFGLKEAYGHKMWDELLSCSRFYPLYPDMANCLIGEVGRIIYDEQPNFGTLYSGNTFATIGLIGRPIGFRPGQQASE